MAKLRGLYLALLAALVSGVSVFVNKFAVTAVNNPLAFTTVKNIGVALLILGLLLAGGKWRLIFRLSRRDVGFLLLIGIVGGSLPFYLFFTGLSQISAVNGAIIQKTLVIWVALLALPLLKEKLSRTVIAAVVILFGANVLVGGFSGFKFSAGEGMVLLATLLWAAETVLAKTILPRIDPDILTFARMGFGALILLFISSFIIPTALDQMFEMNLSQWAWVGLTAVLLLTYVTVWYRALKYASAITVTSILVVSTLVTNVLTAVFITHSYNFLHILQSLLIIAGIILIYRRQNLLSPVA